MIRRTVLLTAGFLGALAPPAFAEPPHDWLFRASPGLGYTVDAAQQCSMQGRAFVGGFALGHELRDRVFLSAATTIFFNTLLADAPCTGEDGLRLAIGMLLGPSVEWFPYEDHGLSLFGLAGYVNMDHDGHEMYGIAHGIGTTLGAGWDWQGETHNEMTSRFGVRLQVTATNTWTTAFRHRTVMPSVVFVVGWD